MMRTALVFLIGFLFGANLVYFMMAGRDRDAPRASTPVPAATTPASQTASDPTVARARTTRATAAAVPGDDLLIPVQGIGAAQLTDTYGDARGSDRSHNAMDIMAPTGTPVVAVADGKLVKIFNSEAGGLTLYQFDPTETYTYYYAHLDRYADGLAEGQMLRRGQVIGYVGSTGNANPAAPHLHFAIYRLGPGKRWHEGTPINPYPLLRG